MERKKNALEKSVDGTRSRPSGSTGPLGGRVAIAIVVLHVLRRPGNLMNDHRKAGIPTEAGADRKEPRER